jgi:hypothetical protein
MHGVQARQGHVDTLLFDAPRRGLSADIGWEAHLQVQQHRLRSVAIGHASKAEA